MRGKHLLAALFLVSLVCCAICASVLLICSAAFAGYLLQPGHSARPAAAGNLSFGGSLLVRSQEQMQCKCLHKPHSSSRLGQHQPHYKH